MNNLKDIEIPIKGYGIFTISQSDWEQAPIPICMSLVSESEWHQVAKSLMELEFYDDASRDSMEDEIWCAYENAVVKLTSAKYYEDITN